MGYRGEDIDLRIPQGWGVPPRTDAPPAGAEGQPNWWTRTAVYNGGRTDPLWVDDVVMACCNHAFDLAVAHRAGEVRVEHLISAMTLTDAAVAVLEARGIRVPGLRRDVANIIAAEQPIPFPNGRVRPRKSDDLEEVLWFAADRAYPRRTPVTVDDLIDVLLEGNRSIPAVALLHRFTGPPRDYEVSSVPPPARPYAPEPRYYDTYEPRRPIAPPQPVMTAVADPRLDGMERLLRDMAQDISADRKALAAAVTSIETRLAEAMAAQASVRAELLERIAALSSNPEGTAAITAQLGELERASTLGLDRLARLERNDDTHQVALAALPQHFDQRAQAAIEAVGEHLAQRIGGVEQLVENRAAETGRVVAFVSDRLRGFEDALIAVRDQVGQMASAFGARLDDITDATASAHRATAGELKSHADQRFSSLQTAIAEGTRTTAEIGAGHVEDLMEIHDAIDKLSGALNEWRLDTTGDLSIVSNRLASLEASAMMPYQSLEGMRTALVDLQRERRMSWWRRFRLWLFGTERMEDMGWKRLPLSARMREKVRAARGELASSRPHNPDNTGDDRPTA